MNQKVGKIKKIIYDDKKDTLELLIEVTDKKFQKKLLRDLTFSGNLSVDGDKLVYVTDEDDNNAEL
jgi:hypothetical protein